MTIFRVLWRATVTCVAVVALVAAGTHLGALVTVGTTGAMAAVGALMGYGWVEDAGRWRLTVTLAQWFGAGTLLLLGLPMILGGWSLLVVVLLAVMSPPVVHVALGRLGTVSDRSLARRWQNTAAALRQPGLRTDAALALVVERERLLDELERRDPGGFALLLARAGWPTGSIVD